MSSKQAKSIHRPICQMRNVTYLQGLLLPEQRRPKLDVVEVKTQDQRSWESSILSTVDRSLKHDETCRICRGQNSARIVGIWPCVKGTGLAFSPSKARRNRDLDSMLLSTTTWISHHKCHGLEHLVDVARIAGVAPQLNDAMPGSAILSMVIMKLGGGCDGGVRDSYAGQLVRAAHMHFKHQTSCCHLTSLLKSTLHLTTNLNRPKVAVHPNRSSDMLF